MCGIFGAINYSGKKDLKDLASRMERAIIHRGPDEQSACFFKNGFVGNVRLSIVDRAGGQQPIFTENKRFGIVYNGEVYNHKKLRRELEGLGVAFHTDSDTEVVLNVFAKWGKDGLSKLEGMFAFCIWDSKENRFYLVRDRLGIKPLYFARQGKTLFFGSELKSILYANEITTKINPLAIQDYLHFRFIPGESTIFNHVFKLEAGNYLEIHGDSVVHNRYWEIEANTDRYGRADDSLIKELDTLLRDAVESQLMGEVPVGVLLSGGIDSSLIASYVKDLGANLKTFNIGFPEINEFRFSREVANGLDLEHFEITTTVDELVDRYLEVSCALDEPIADPACLPLYILCQTLKKHVTVVLSGEGGDELFGGYNQYKSMVGSKSPWWELQSEFSRASWYFDSPHEFMARKDLPPQHLRFGKYLEGTNFLQGMLNYDLKTWMPDDLMMKADKILMAHSLEGRFPFLDDKLVDFSLSIAPDFKIRNGQTKFILKELARAKLPASVVDRPKMGFTVPVPELLEKLKPVVYEAISLSKKLEIAEHLNLDKISELVGLHYSDPRKGHTLKVWTIFSLLFWYNRVISVDFSKVAPKGKVNTTIPEVNLV